MLSFSLIKSGLKIDGDHSYIQAAEFSLKNDVP